MSVTILSSADIEPYLLGWEWWERGSVQLRDLEVVATQIGATHCGKCQPEGLLLIGFLYSSFLTLRPLYMG
jgi:hypothetical protein